MDLSQAASMDEVKENESGMTQPARKHHYIPKFYQRGFTADGRNRIWVYERGREPRQYSVRKTGMMIDLYGFTNQQKKFDTDTVEKELARIDSEAARIVKNLEDGFSIGDAERRHLCRFVSIMWRRTPKHKEEAEKMAAAMIPKFFAEHDEKWLYAEVKRRVRSDADAERIYEQQRVELQKVREEYSSSVPDFLFAKNTLRHSMFEQVMYVMDWAFFQSTSEEEFLTCDNPVAFSKGSGDLVSTFEKASLAGNVDFRLWKQIRAAIQSANSRLEPIHSPQCAPASLYLKTVKGSLFICGQMDLQVLRGVFYSFRQVLRSREGGRCRFSPRASKR